MEKKIHTIANLSCYQRVTDQEGSLRRTNSPFSQGNGNDLRLRNPNLFCTTSHGQSSHVSPQQLEYLPGARPFEHHPGQRADAPEFGEFQWIPEIKFAQSSKNRVKGFKEWPCHHNGCNESYRRRQEVIRHIRDKHEIPPKCFICGIKWTRAEKIRKHLISRHRDHFKEEERQEIRRLRGLNNTIEFLKKLEIHMALQ
jgi:hypothetical protein